MAYKEVKHDKYCWKCCSKNTTMKCSNCVRAFHKRCVSSDGRDVPKDKNWLCPVCSVLTSENVDKENDLKILPVLIDKIWNDESFETLKYPMENSIHADIKVIHSIVNPMDLYQIKRKTHTYTGFNEFYVDICWIVHNCVILFKETHDNTKAARALLNCIIEDVQSAKVCFECYLNANKHPDQWFSMVCDEPHLIIWIKKTGANYWPAKLIKIVTGQEVKVRLFGDHSYVDVSSSNCLLYSESSPSRIPKSPDAYNSALKEANTYIGNLTKKFGSFRFAESKTAFNPALLEYYIAQLIPGSVEYRRNKNAANVTDATDLYSDDSSRIIREADTTCPDVGEYTTQDEHFIEEDQISDESVAILNYSYEPGSENDSETDFQYNSSLTQLAADDVIVID
ncbi:MYND-type zinc finger-containing chromatin reader ZMYND8-like [Sitodiplosis mosellana]|uniref:MYND-type zinc finger-containing chromatin reader ZMYND8-like n=1 Tax=Sitodiplosis mosellana TaxID=263140 RepID=UPI00244452AA|nr:MYND-type zinc finger-containing chromatin reader ZMYND8-like [Sitodiplosis mosellana]